MIKKTDLISYIIIAVSAGIFIGFVLCAIYVKNVFRQEMLVSVTPIGISNIYYSGDVRYGRIPRQTFKVVFKNGVQVYDEWIGYK